MLKASFSAFRQFLFAAHRDETHETEAGSHQHPFAGLGYCSHRHVVETQIDAISSGEINVTELKRDRTAVRDKARLLGCPIRPPLS